MFYLGVKCEIVSNVRCLVFFSLFLLLSKQTSMTRLGPFLLTLLSEPTILPLLLLHAELPLLGDLHVVVFEPDQILAVSPVGRQHLIS